MTLAPCVQKYGRLSMHGQEQRQTKNWYRDMLASTAILRPK